jgi:enediyne biosynthesis protein E4
MFPAIRALSLSAFLLAATSPLVQSQEKPTQGPDSAHTVESNHAVQLDAEHRVITAGGFVKSGPIVFQDISEKSGLARWTHHMGAPAKDYIIETKGSGVCLFDYDNDGWLDIYLVNGSTLEAIAGKATPPHAALFHNNHDGTFTDLSAKAGVQNDRWGMGCAVADYDNDGYPDLYVSNFGNNRLYHNNKNGTFSDLADQARVTLGNWSTGVTWGDYDGDGKLDLFVAGYLHWDWENPPAKGGEGGSSNSFCTFRGEATACGPRGLKGEPDHLFHNNGDGTFTDVSDKAGVADKPGYYGLGAVFVDINNDGKPDLLVGNDSTPNYLYINKGDGTFEDDSYASGYALNEAGRETASMGIAVGDTQNKGMLDVFNTTFSDDYKPLYRNEGDANFTDVSYHIGLGEVTVPFLSWGDAFFDYDNDGWKDLMMSDGHVYPQADKYNWGTSWKERPMLFHNLQGKSFENVPAVEGTGLAAVIAGRGMAVGDLFNDGKIDAVINVMDGHPVLLRNVEPNRNHWIELKLTGGGKTPRDATGAVVYVTTGAIKQRGDVISGGSYLSNNDSRLHFGVGTSTKIDDVEIHWADGKVQHASAPSIDKIISITESTK